MDQSWPSEPLLKWYDTHARELPWRMSPADRKAGKTPDPYRVWLSEIMLQQTTIAHATRYFIAFTERWPTIDDLSAASRDDVMAAWAGLGYYSRARNLHKCAQTVTELGAFPNTVKDLLALPGVGPYTAGAIGAIAFDLPVAAIDGNVDRVASRLLALDMPWDEAKTEIKNVVPDWVPAQRPGDFAQALMDLGATICTPKKAMCDKCPLTKGCKAYAEGQPETYPIKPKKKAQPTRYGWVVIETDGESFKVERRPDKGLLGGMLGLPGSEWVDDPAVLVTAPKQYTHIGAVTHVFTHFRLELDVYVEKTDGFDGESLSLSPKGIGELPSVFAKAAKAVKAYVSQTGLD